MKFGFVDRIVELTRGESIVAVKAVSRAEEYLADHFPTFPVLPGVLMLEALAESAAWLIRDAEDFASTVILLSRAKNVTYKSFVRPGSVLTLTVTCRRRGDRESDFSGVGHCGDKEVVSARFSMLHTTVGQRLGTPSATDRSLMESARARFVDLRR